MRYLIITLSLTLALAFLSNNARAQDNPPYKYSEKDAKKTSSGLRYVIVKKGEGATAKKGDKIKAHYHGMLPDGTVFDSSFERGQPFQTPIGVGRVIKGWDEAFQMLPVGTKAVLIIPPDLGYGEGGMPQAGIPPNTPLIFHVELLDVQHDK